MKKNIAYLMAVLMILVSFIPAVPAKAASRTLKSMSVLNEPKVTEYCVGDKLDTKGLSVLLTYSDEMTETVTNGYSVSYDFSTAGVKTVTLTSSSDASIKTSFNVNVYENPKLVIKNYIVNHGAAFYVPIYVSGNYGLMGMDLFVEYDSSVFQPVSISNTGLLKGESLENSIATSTESNYHVIWAGSSAVSGDGKLVSLKFCNISSSNATKSSIKVSAVRDNTYTENYAPIAIASGESRITIRGVSASADASGDTDENISSADDVNTVIKKVNVYKTITVKKPVIKVCKNVKRRKIKLKFSKVSGAKGYEISLSKKKNMKQVTLCKLSKSKSACVFSGLAKNKTYYVRIRAYKTYKNVTYYSGWSSIKKVKIRR